MLVFISVDDSRLPRSVAFSLLLEQAEQIVRDILRDAYRAQDAGKPITMLGELEKMRQAVSEFSAQAGRLVQSRFGTRRTAGLGRYAAN